MDKITHQVRAEHWAKIMNECINSGMSKTAWCRANGISEKQFFYWQRILRRKLSRILRIHYYRQLSNRSRNWLQRLKGRSLLLRSSFHLLLRAQLRFSSGSRDPERQSHSGDFEFCIGRASLPDWRAPGC